MTENDPDAAKTDALRIGVITEPLGPDDSMALRYLILHLNTLQLTFEFELLPGPPNVPLLATLASKRKISRKSTKAQLPMFVERIKEFIEQENRTFGCQEPPPSAFVILSLARFDDEYYSTRAPDDRPICSIIALGNWKRSMAPPTLVEFFLVLLLRNAVALSCPSLSGSIHFGTKGCLFDFNSCLADVRYEVLNAFVCDRCSKDLDRDGRPSLKQELIKVLAKEWLGSSDEPNSVASITSKLGHNLFFTKGLRPTVWENVHSVLQQEAVKQVLTVIGTVLAAGLVFFFGFKTGKP